MNKLLINCCFVLLALNAFSQQSAKDSVYIVSHYHKLEQMIPMRDGAKLYTAIYIPNDSTEKHPVLITRTPYSCAPYGREFKKDWKSYHAKYYREKYIMVYQDVRGRYMSEGDYMDIRPFNPAKTGKETDEASDTYDTIDWLVNEVKSNNGNVGVFGISYPGFYSTMAALSGHPALKVVSPQAPVTDWFIGDDFHHKGALMLMDAFDFYKGFGVPRPHPSATYNPGFEIKEVNKYRFYLSAGPLPDFNKKWLGDSISFWNDLMQHPVYDEWWKQRNPRNYVAGIKPAILVVGGLFDAEDLFGAWNLYKAIEAGNPPTHENKIIMGPWFHGAWEGRSEGDLLGKIKFGSKTSAWYQDSIEFPFFQHHLNNKAPADLKEATIFFSGENKWKTFDKWPPATSTPTPVYLQAKGKLSFRAPRASADSSNDFTRYVSDPSNPVPYEGGLIQSRTREYMTADQRFTRNRQDVVRFTMAPQTEPLTLAGPVIADLVASVSSTDADFVVKLIDVFPQDISSKGRGADTIYRHQAAMNGYEMLVRAEIMRGKFRNSFETAEPFEPGKPTEVTFELPDVAHTFLPGHRVMIEIQSSWFPLADRNPQTFTDIYKAKQADFKKAVIRIYHKEGQASKIILPVSKIIY